jgi:chromosome segregation ATPase
MKNFQQNVLILLALLLCGLCVFQWRAQTVQRNEITTMNGLMYEKNVAFQNATNSVATMNHQMDQMDASLTELKAAAATNQQLMASQKAEIVKLQFANENLTNEILQYKAAVDTLTAKLKDTYAGIGKQNEVITNLVSQRNDFVQKYNDEVKDRNDIVGKYNELAKQMEKLQANGDNSAHK